MLKNIYKLLCLIMVMTACHSNVPQEKKNINDAGSMEIGYSITRLPLSGYDFKVPVPQGYNWEITESWEKHCDYCNSKGYDKISDGYFGDFCQLSHSTNNPNDNGCFDYCKFGWDFNLPSENDLGRSVLASGDGVVLVAKSGKKSDGSYVGGGWGNTVVIDHGNNICSRYAHMKDSSISVSEGDNVCQGLKIGEVGGTPSVGVHLHFQFESCDEHKPLEMGFTDGNDVPKCIMGKDLYTDGVYTALKLTNVEKSYCTEDDLMQKDPPSTSPPPQVCGLQCPMNEDCPNKNESPFEDINSADDSTSWAVNYLWHECAVNGKSDGDFHADDTLTRAEALKIALALFGLENGCEGTLEPFGDVNPTQWFYADVVCGVKYGIISTDYSGFNPNDEVYFGEATKMAVLSAKKAGKATLKTGTYKKFPKMGMNHWAYPYLQTLAYYNGIDKDLLEKDPYDLVTRGEYARMVAALSPCYCENNKCQGGCECNQASYVCGPSTVATDGNPGSGKYGGSGSDMDAFSSSTGGEDAGSAEVAENVCKPYCYNKECGSDLCDGSCGTCPADSFCGYQDKCTKKCFLPSCEEIGCECGKCPLSSPGCDGTSLVCGECAEGKMCIAGKCNADPCYNCPTEKCVNGQCLADTVNWKCDPDKGFSVWVGSEGGKWSISHIIAGTNNISPVDTVGLMPMGYFITPSIQGACDELPMVALIKGGPQGIKLLVDNKSQPPIEVWQPYDGPLTFDPATPPTLKTYYVDVPTPDTTMLIRIQAPVGQELPVKLPADANPKSVSDCDPAKGYEIYFSTPNQAKWETTTSPEQKYSWGTFSGPTYWKVNCSELPAFLRVSNLSDKVTIWLKNTTLPPFVVWPDSEATIPLKDPTNPNLVTSVLQYFTALATSQVLIKIPKN